MGFIRFITLTILCLSLGTEFAEAKKLYSAKYEAGPKGATLIFEGLVDTNRKVQGTEVIEVSYPSRIEEHEKVSEEKIVELFSANQDAIASVLENRKVAMPVEGLPVADAADEVQTIFEGGPTDNRIDLVFIGDGYTQSERQKFFDDMTRLTKDMFEGNTFGSYLPLFNVYAVFRPSKESGIGKNDKPKDTAFKLYRAGNTLRAIYTGNPSAARSACQAAPACDFPILIGNDPYYGGLGGEFAISTSSVSSGTVVLRHELGHNFGRVGEEYDGGGYFGANHSSSVDAVTWKHWLSGPAKAEPARALNVSWPWHHLAKGVYTTTLKVGLGNFPNFDLDLSLSGMETDEDIVVTLDGKRMDVRSPGNSDRFYTLIQMRESGLTQGNHELKFEEKVKDGNNWVSNIKVSQFAPDYHFESGYVGAFPLFGEDLSEDGYRPTHEGCLMRKMPHDKFCPVCQENNWVQFFNNVKLVDSIEAFVEGNAIKVVAHTLDLGKFRKLGSVEGETFDIKWFKDGVEQTELAGLREWTTTSELTEKWEAEVTFSTPEIRKSITSLKMRSLVKKR